MKIPSIISEKIQTLFKKYNWYWAVSFAVTFIVAWIYFPSITRHAEMWYENASNFFYFARVRSVWDTLRTLDAGYLPLLPRLISLPLVKLGVVTWYPLITQSIAIAFLALFYSFLNWRVFRPLVQSDAIRFLITVLFSVVLFRDIEFTFFHNFAYVGFLFMLLTLFVPKDKISLPAFWGLVVMNALLFASKSYFVIFAPLFLVSAWLGYRKNSIREVVFTLGSFVGLLLQVAAIKWLNQAPAAAAPGAELNITVSTYEKFHLIVVDTLFYFVQTYVHVFVQNIKLLGPGAHVIGFLGMIGVASVLYYVIRKRGVLHPAVWFFIAANVLAIGYLFVTAYINHSNLLFNGQYPFANWKVFFIFPHTRHFYIAYVLVVFGGLVLMTHAIKLRVVQAGIIIAFAVFAWNTDRPQEKDRYRTDEVSVSQWEYYHPLIQRDQYCIPANDSTWMMLHNCRVLNIGGFIPQSSDRPVQTFDLTTAEPLRTEEWNVSAFLIQQPNSKQPQKIRAIVKDRSGAEITRIDSTTPDDYKYQYYLLDTPQVIGSVSFTDAAGAPISIPPQIYFYGTTLTGVQQLSPEVVGQAALGPVVGPMVDTETLTQTIMSTHNGLSGVSLFLATYARVNTCSVSMDLTDSATGALVYSHTESCGNLKDNSYWSLFFDPIPDSAGKTYTATLRVSGAKADNTITAYTTAVYNRATLLTVGSNRQINASLVYNVFYNNDLP